MEGPANYDIVVEGNEEGHQDGTEPQTWIIRIIIVKASVMLWTLPPIWRSLWSSDSKPLTETDFSKKPELCSV